MKSTWKERWDDFILGLKCFFISGKRVAKNDPVTFWCSIIGIVTGNASIFLSLYCHKI